MAKPNLITLCGIPGAGKTSIRNRFNSTEWIICSSDDLIPLDDEGNRIYNPENLNRSWSQVWINFGRAMAQQKNIILDNTFLRSQERTSVCNIAKGLNYHTILIWVSTPFRDCLINNVCRRHPVPDKVMREKRRSLQVPSYKEGWDLIVSIKDTDFGLVWDFLTDQFIPLEEFCLNANS